MVKKNRMTFKREPVLMFACFIIFSLLLIFIILPLFSVIKISLVKESRITGGIYQFLFTRNKYRQAMANSIKLGISSATFSTIIGFTFAYSIQRVKLRATGLFKGMVVLPLISPPFMFALSVVLLLGRNGLITEKLLGLSTMGIYGFKGLLLVQSISMFPLAYLILSGTLQGIDPDLESCAMNLGAKRLGVFRTITLPLSMQGIFAAWLLNFIGSLTDFGNPIIIGGDFNVLSTLAYFEFSGMGNIPRGTALAILLLLPTVVVVIAQRYILKNRNFSVFTGMSSQKSTPVTSIGGKVFLFLFCSIISVFIILTYITLIAGSFIEIWGVDWSFTLNHFIYSFDVGIKTMVNTLVLALISTPITVFLGMFIAYVTVRKAVPGKNLLEFISMLSYAIPGTALGIGYILVFNKFPFKLSGTAFILVAAYIFRNIPIGVEGGIAALRQISPEIEESGTNLGGCGSYTFRKVTLPLIIPSFFTCTAISFIKSMTAISAIIFLVSARWNHLSVLVLSQTEAMRLGAASVISFSLIIVILPFLYIMSKLSGMINGQIFRAI